MSIDKKYIDYFVNVTSKAALASSYLVGKKDKIAADKVATDAMRSELNKLNIKGKVVIGEGEFTTVEILDALRDKTPTDCIEGIAFINNDNQFIKTPARKACKIDTLPMINWDLFDKEKLFNVYREEFSNILKSIDSSEIPEGYTETVRQYLEKNYP